MKTKKIILAILLFIFVSIKAQSQPIDSSYATILQNKINELKASNNLVGISAAVFIPGFDVWTGTAGISDSTDPLTENHVFGAGSITKNFMASLTLQLYDEGQLNLEDTIGTWITGNSNINGKITIRQLLNHRSGIHNFTDNPAFGSAMQSNYNRLWNPDEFLNYVLTPYFQPGQGWRYSNSNYMILGLILSDVTGDSVHTLLRNRIYNPFQLSETSFNIYEPITSPLAHNWVDLNGNGTLDDASTFPLTAIYSSTASAGAIISRPENLVRYISQLFNSGIISDSAITQMTQFSNVSISGANGYGLGLSRFNVGGKNCWGHGGNIFGYASVVMYYPAEGIAIAVMMNKDIVTGGVGISFMNTAIANNPVSIANLSSELPSKFTLFQNYPNPFNPSTKIRFELPGVSSVKLMVYDILGREITVLKEGKLQGGTYEYTWDPGNLTSGIYYYKLITDNYSETKKMLLLK